MADQSSILLQTKLHRPSVTRGLITRWRLIEQLNNVIDYPLTLITAPAGFGKTTLVSNWLGRMAAGQDGGISSFPSAWLSLDQDDNDLNLFVRYLIAALRTIFNEACPATQALLQARQQPPQAVLYNTFSNELEELPGDCILVLDDYHSIRVEAVHNLLAELTRHWPQLLHLVLISRTAPPIPLPGLRARGMLNEIRSQELRFTPQETAAFLSRAQFAHLNEAALNLLQERFEGWPAGLHLAALSLRRAGGQESILSALSGPNPDINEYLVDEVLDQQVSAIHSFLLKTSILNRFCASLCEAILGDTDSAWNAQACLDWIEHSELFISSLDDRGQWYRYHQLFQESLQRALAAEMTADRVANLHRQASAWFEEQILVEDALHHALAAGDFDLAARQMSAGLRDVLNREDRPTLARWLKMLPEEMIQQRPDLLMIRVWDLQFAWRLDLQARMLQRVEELLDSEMSALLPAKDLQILRAQVLLPKAQQAYFLNQMAGAAGLCRQALALFPPTWAYARGGAMLYLGLSMLASGQGPAAEQLLLAEYELCNDKTNIYALFLLQALGYIYFNTSQLEKARQNARLLIHESIPSKIEVMKNWGYYLLAVVCYQCNELETAAQYFNQIVDNRYIAHGAAYHDAVAGLARIHQIVGESAQAWQMVESVSQFDLEQQGREDDRTRSLRAGLMLLQGDLNGAGRWADTFTELPPDRPLQWLEEPQLTRARILVARGTDADLQLVWPILDALNEIADRTYNTHFKMEILALRALALDAQGQTGQADAELMQAVKLARSGGVIRIFADLGQPMQAMLRRLANQNHSAEAIHRILAAFPEDDRHLADSERLGRRPSFDDSTLAEPLTRRELEVLSLLREPLSIREIALRLHISYATVKRHTINLYGKLGVNDRWSAVARAKELDILRPR